MEGVSIDTITVADEGSRWSQLGFKVGDEGCQLGSVVLHFAGGQQETPGIVDWWLRGLRSSDLDGLPTKISERAVRGEADPHPNRVASIDHVVATSPDLDRSVAQLKAAGLDLRRIREHQPRPEHHARPSSDSGGRFSRSSKSHRRSHRHGARPRAYASGDLRWR